MPKPAAFSGDNRIVVDWDGTCVPEEWPDHPEMWDDAAWALFELKLAGKDIVIASTRLAPRGIDELTSRSRAERAYEVDYIRGQLRDKDLDYVGIWRKPWKPGASHYVDDKGVRYDRDNGGWEAVLKEVLG